MPIKLAKFNTFTEAENKLKELSDLAKSISSTEPFSLTNINTSADGTWFWFVFEPDCLENTGLAKDGILLKQLEMDILEFDEIPENWFNFY